MKTPILETERLILRGHTHDDFKDSVQMWADPEVVRFIGGTPSSQSQSWLRFLAYLGHWKLLGYGYWVIEDKLNKDFIGEVGLADWKRKLSISLDVPESGWVIHPSQQGKGYAAEAMIAVLKWVDNNIDSKQTYCIIDPEHKGSIKIAKKLGYNYSERIKFNNVPVDLFFRDRC